MLAPLDFRLLEIKDVDDAEVDLAHRSAVVVDEADAALRVLGCQKDFFINLAKHGLAVGAVKERRISGADVPANADRRLSPPDA